MSVMSLCMIEFFRQEDRRTRFLFFLSLTEFFLSPTDGTDDTDYFFFLCAILTASKGALRIFTDLDSLRSLFF